MIGVYFSGRLGNQFFRYAYARTLLETRGGDEQLVFNFRRVSGNSAEGFEDSLKHFNVKKYDTDNSSLVIKHGNTYQKLLYIYARVAEKIARMLHLKIDVYAKLRQSLAKNGIIILGSGDNNVEIPPIEGEKIFINGFFENKKYFDNIRQILLEEFTPKRPPLQSNAQLYDIISNNNSVCVSIRRGDYLDKGMKSFNVCDENYFLNAIEEIKKRVNNPVFIFFSDDIEWVKRNIKINDKCYYESGKDPVYEKIRLMYSCKHFIISNSTFSWWAQYLSRNQEKVIVSPKHWFNDLSWNSYLIADDFIRI